MKIELDKFRWCESDVQRWIEKQVPPKLKRSEVSKSTLPKPENGSKYIRGPIPLEWIQLAIPLGRKAINVAVAIWFTAGFKRENPVRLTAATLRKFGVAPPTTRIILSRFESAGLVKVARKRGRSPIVTILPTNGCTGWTLTNESRVR